MQPVQNYLTELLRDLSVACKTVKTADECVELSHKYDLIILSENGVYNVVQASHLTHTLSKCYSIKVTYEEIHPLIPTVCDLLHIDYFPMFSATDLYHTTPADYQIFL